MRDSCETARLAFFFAIPRHLEFLDCETVELTKLKYHFTKFLRKPLTKHLMNYLEGMSNKKKKILSLKETR